MTLPSTIAGRCRTPALGGLALILALALSAGCSDDATAIVLEVRDDLAPGEIDKVTFHVTGPGLPAAGRTATATVTGPGKTPFPLTLTLIYGGAPRLGPMVATAEAWFGSEATPQARSLPTHVSFERGRVVRKRLHLQRIGTGGAFGDAGNEAAAPGDASIGEAGPDGTAVPADGAVRDGATELATSRDGAADTAAPGDGPAGQDAASDRVTVPTPDTGVSDGAPRDVPAETRIDAPGTVDTAMDMSIPPVDAQPDVTTPPMDASRDVTTPPADVGPGGCGTGCACQQSCPEGTACRCAAGCACDLTCDKNKDCQTTCTGAGTRCTVNSVDVSNGQVTCSDGAMCLVDASGKTSNIDVTCSGADCQVICTGSVSNCRLACTGGARCIVHCEGASNCGFESCAAGLLACPGSIYVCNRPCP